MRSESLQHLLTFAAADAFRQIQNFLDLERLIRAAIDPMSTTFFHPILHLLALARGQDDRYIGTPLSDRVRGTQPIDGREFHIEKDRIVILPRNHIDGPGCVRNKRNRIVLTLSGILQGLTELALIHARDMPNSRSLRSPALIRT